VEASLVFPEVHKRILPIFYGMSVDDCHQMDREVCHKLAAMMTALHKGSETDKQFAESISQEVYQMTKEQLQSNSLTLWKTDWLIESSLDQCQQLSQLTDALNVLILQLEVSIVWSCYLLVYCLL
jgi:hypothetical protein